MVQDPPAPTLDPQVLVWEKVVEPVIVMPLIVSVALPTFVSVTVCGGGGQVGGSSWQEKDRLAGTSFTTVPVPLRETFWGLSAALSLTVTLPVRAPVVAGLKTTLNVQLAPAARLEGQARVWAKSLASAKSQWC